MHFLLLKSSQIGVQERMWVMFSFGSDYSVIIREGRSMGLEMEGLQNGLLKVHWIYCGRAKVS